MIDQISSTEWLKLVVRSSSNLKAVEAAQNTLNSYEQYTQTLKRYLNGQRRSLWDLMAGIENGRDIEDKGIATINFKGYEFNFHVFKEACFRRGKVPSPDAIESGVNAPYRMPQKQKWGNDCLKT